MVELVLSTESLDNYSLRAELHWMVVVVVVELVFSTESLDNYSLRAELHWVVVELIEA